MDSISQAFNDFFKLACDPTLRQRRQSIRGVIVFRSCRYRRIHHVTQSVTISPGTRANSRPLAVTRVAPRRRAWAAMRQS
jgi:hypothetical protein